MKRAYHLSRETDDTSNDFGTEENNFSHTIVISKPLKCDIIILRIRTDRQVGVIFDVH